MNSEIFEEWVRKLDRKFRADDRKIALINCSYYSINLKLDERSNRIFAPKYDIHSSTVGSRCHTQPLSALLRKGCTFVTQSLGEKRALSKDINFAISEDTG